MKNLQKAGVQADVDVYHGKVHAFDMLFPWRKDSKAARRQLCEEYERHLLKRD